jgi:pimeloyl-ACP methyl ester carboxylesterase
MNQPQPMRDVIVLVPGILGSVLVKDGREVWGASAQSVVGNLVTFGRALKDLKLEPGVGHEDPKDGVSAPRILPRLYMIPTFWKADGYGKLRERLSRRLTLTPATDDQPGNLIEFPYDWRLSNQLNAQRLADAVIPHFERWRHHNPEAKLILICHSMGGLVARWFLEKLGGRELTRTLITIGTPYQGSMNALDALVNWLFLGLGPFGISVDQLVRSFPSVYELLPTYQCLDLGDGQLRGLSGLDLPNTDAKELKKSLEFHEQISAAVEKAPRYQTFAIKGVDQPTSQSALLCRGKVEGASTYVSQKHTILQSTDSILTQLSGMLTGHLGKFMGGARIGVDVSDVVDVGASLPVEATSKDGDPDLPLQVVCTSEAGQEYGGPILMRPTGDGRYHAKVDGLPEGAWLVTVQSATPARPVEPVSDWVLVWKANAF